MDTNTEFGYITTEEAARILGASRKTIVRKVEKGLLPGVKIARRILVDREGLEQLKKQFKLWKRNKNYKPVLS
ncbi:MAG: helix-turn-helix domain-containing protein [Tepidanaerobacteraceae bacterium]|jgi:excisionase family DNA binding protein|nr:helix-turn-helix domain-containing protein [Tepidanaerobacteraceae bacterium]